MAVIKNYMDYKLQWKDQPKRLFEAISIWNLSRRASGRSQSRKRFFIAAARKIKKNSILAKKYFFLLRQQHFLPILSTEKLQSNQKGLRDKRQDTFFCCYSLLKWKCQGKLDRKKNKILKFNSKFQIKMNET